jgi:2-polyprenyl-3-methyl-5-hydroxy-6-metoxy-1,4-benzoquinol methylase
METLRNSMPHTKAGPVATSTYLQREKCPGCFAPVEKSRLSVFSTPTAENLSMDAHGKFLSGYTNQRVFFSYHRCEACDLLFCPTYFTQDQLNSLYKSQSENMAEAPHRSRASTQKAYYDILMNYAIPEGDYLEIGADIGLFAKFFATKKEIKNLFLYEPNCEVHETLKNNVAHKSHKIFTKNYSASDIEPGTLSVAVIIHTLDHILNPRQLMKEIYQNLKPGGIVFIVTHDEASLLAKVLKKKWPPFTLQHPHLFNPSTMQSLLEAEGFDWLGCKKTPNYFPLTHFIKGGLSALGLNKFPIPNISKFIIPIKLGNIASIAQKPLKK